MTHRPLRLKFLAAALAAALLLAVAASSGPITQAQAATPCKPPSRYPGSGYFTSLKVSRTSCATGRKLTLAYYRCRVKNGRAGTCNKRVLNYRCTEKRNRIPTEINARVTCKRGSRTIVHTYQQNT